MMTPWLAQRAVDRKDAPALSVGDRTYTYAELAAEVQRRAAGLAAMGIERGATVGLRAQNSLDWVLGAHAVFWRGATLVPLHPRATDAELDFQLSQLDFDLLLVDPNDAAPDTTVRTVPLDELRGPEDTVCRAARVAMDDVMTVLFTSGTTGKPKAVPLTVQNHLSSASASALRLGLCENDNWLCCLPLCHTGGLAIVLRSAIYGTSFELLDGFSTDDVLAVLAERPVTLASFVPTMVYRLLEACEGAVESKLRAVLVGGGPIEARLLGEARRRGIPALPTYGMTEASSQLATLSPHADGHLDTAGTALEGVELRIEREDGTLCDADEAGAIWARGPMIMDGYLNRPDENTARFRDGWFRTGDIGRIDRNGFLRIEHRLTDLIVTGGENVDPGEVEAVLRAASGVRDVAVVGLDDPEWGEVVAAAVVPSEPVDEPAAFFEELGEHCKSELAGFKTPQRWVICSELPQTHSGKIHREQTRQLLRDAPVE
ncbi:o-succinylbenzoate--CoA ligase [Persicimonas caeni]|uniref:2-succinylbenzoate--CoA ligase n=1 Tax=Persicimonas caeni TaxID=2292766 RepID=A0A4Y6Q1E1_PERCE|nr:o-succinylbenzoate--CoA ligase [Persicimonas caeni]QDG54398.1 o-succinylbenzoate--CoA ligase [Persicimonas caeni]QED35619.1 o-succinylbenzoate--CoA ligase [Persicimonas caeni]